MLDFLLMLYALQDLDSMTWSSNGIAECRLELLSLIFKCFLGFVLWTLSEHDKDIALTPNDFCLYVVGFFSKKEESKKISRPKCFTVIVVTIC